MGISGAIKHSTDNAGAGNKGDRGPGFYPALRIVIAGGGTGGHLFPGIAIAESFVRRCPETRVLFVTSGKPIEETVLAKSEFDAKRICVEGIKGKGLFPKLASVCRLPKGMYDALRLLLAFKPDIVIGMGAYSAGPIIVGAWMLRICRVIHEQNSIPGLTNRMLSSLVHRIYVSFPDTGFKPSVADKIMFTGNPVRREIVHTAEKGSDGRTETKDDSGLFTVLVLGGSQGAHSINVAVLDSLTYLEETGKFRFIHQTGVRDADEVEKVYRQLKVTSVVAPFFNDMANQYRQADLIVCRSGATTVAELTVCGKAAVFVPFPFATEDHQAINAKAMVTADAAEMILEKDLNGEILAGKISYYADHPEVLEKMESRVRDFGRPDAAEIIVDDIYKMIQTRGGKTAHAA